MNEKILPFTTDPPVRCFPNYACALGAVFAKDNRAFPWFYSSFINVFGSKKYSDMTFFGNETWFPTWPQLNTLTIKISKETSYQEFRNFIKYMINKNYYIYTMIDEYYIPTRSAYKHHHFYHDIFIHGYSDEKLIISGYTNRGFFEDSTIDITDFISALNAIDIENNNIYFFKVISDYDYKIDLNFMIDSFNYYLNSTAENTTDFTDYNFGINAFERFKERIENSLDYSEIQGLRHFFFIWEHKKSMLGRLRFLTENGYINDNSIPSDYSIIEEKARFLLNVALKSNAKKVLYKNKMIELLDFIIGEEKIILNRMLNQLSK